MKFQITKKNNLDDMVVLPLSNLLNDMQSENHEREEEREREDISYMLFFLT